MRRPARRPVSTDRQRPRRGSDDARVPTRGRGRLPPAVGCPARAARSLQERTTARHRATVGCETDRHTSTTGHQAGAGFRTTTPGLVARHGDSRAHHMPPQNGPRRGPNAFARREGDAPGPAGARKPSASCRTDRAAPRPGGMPPRRPPPRPWSRSAENRPRRVSCEPSRSGHRHKARRGPDGTASAPGIARCAT